jgi:hypothetical protein
MLVHTGAYLYKTVKASSHTNTLFTTTFHFESGWYGTCRGLIPQNADQQVCTVTYCNVATHT